MAGSQFLELISIRTAQWPGSGKSSSAGKYMEVGIESGVENKANETIE